MAENMKGMNVFTSSFVHLLRACSWIARYITSRVKLHWGFRLSMKVDKDDDFLITVENDKARCI